MLVIGLIAMAILLPGTIALNTPAPIGANAERLTIQFKDGSYEILRRAPLTKVLPATVTLPTGAGDIRGSWFEVQTSSGEVLYRRFATAPNVRYVEYRSPDDPSRLKREEAVVHDRTISVLIPAHADAAYLVFYGPADATKARTLPAMEIGRLSLK